MVHFYGFWIQQRQAWGQENFKVGFCHHYFQKIKLIIDKMALSVFITTRSLGKGFLIYWIRLETLQDYLAKFQTEILCQKIAFH